MLDVDRLLSRDEAAAFLNVKSQTLAEWASRSHKGPPYFRVVGTVRYRVSDLENYLSENRVVPEEVQNDA